MIKNIKTEAFVLRKRNLPNQDLIITLFSKEKGKLVILGKGIKKITSRRLPHMQVGNLINVLIHHKENRFYVNESTLISGFSKIKGSEGKLPYFFFALFLADRLLPQEQKEEGIYNELLRFFIELSEVNKFQISRLTQWMNKIMRLLGYIHKEKSYDELRAFIEDIIEEKLPSV